MTVPSVRPRDARDVRGVHAADVLLLLVYAVAAVGWLWPMPRHAWAYSAWDPGGFPNLATADFYLTNGKVGLDALLTGGDDYQTLFTAPTSARAKIEQAGHAVSRIGIVEQGAGVRVLDASGGEMAFESAGWRHFSGPAET